MVGAWLNERLGGLVYAIAEAVDTQCLYIFLDMLISITQNTPRALIEKLAGPDITSWVCTEQVCRPLHTR